MQIIAMYHQDQCLGSIGVHLVTWGVTPMFKPWFVNGSIVYWGDLHSTESAALEAAEILRSKYR